MSTSRPSLPDSPKPPTGTPISGRSDLLPRLDDPPGWTVDEQHSTFDPTQVHKSIYGSHAYYDRPGGSVYIAVVPSTGRPTDCSILIAKVADERCAAVGSASCSP